MTKPLFSRLRAPRKRENLLGLKRQSAQAMTEFIFTFPVVMMMGAGIIHFGLLANAKANLDYAATMAARIAATQPNFGLADSQADSPLFHEILRRMSATDADGYDADEGDTDLARVRVCVESPSDQAFDDWADANGEIPNHNLQFREAVGGPSSGLSIQDANVLRLRVAYLYETGIPGLNIGDSQTGSYRGGGDQPLRLHEESPDYNTALQPNYAHGMWVRTTVALVMQVPAVRNATTRPYIASINGSGVPVCPNFPIGLGG